MPKHPNLRFIEVGLQFKGYEFYLCFSVPVNCVMRHYDRLNRQIQPISLEDWLQLDFPIILAHRLNSSPDFKVVSLSPFVPHIKEPCPVHVGSSSVDSWLNPFVFIIAQTFINCYAKEN